MASTRKRPSSSSPADQRNSRRNNKAKQSPPESNDLTIVGIGASAGGLRALQDFFDSMPANTGMAYVVITHLHPYHESHLGELLQPRTPMPVRQVTGSTKVERDHVYVIPPNSGIIMVDGRLDLKDFDEPRGQRTPVDQFFRSLAKAHPNSVAVILSGGGTDGAVGVKDIKERGGMLLVQHPQEAEHDGMPRAAIATGLADAIVPVRELAGKLVNYTHTEPELPLDVEDLSTPQLDAVERILSQVRARTGHDFSQYKQSTVYRRIRRRMQLNGLATLEAYLDYLRHNPIEATAMFNDILINVTNFFRDGPSWESLAEQVIAELFEGKGRVDQLRVWSVGCATGEEAYATAILLFEQAEKAGILPRFQIFASDLHETALRTAREGWYPAAIEADVSPERLERFFIREGDHYRVRRELRDAVLFTSHSLLRDAPFSRLDLIVCRNVLIYFNRDLQNNVFDIFHYALKPGKFLFLGSSESAESAPDLFEIVDKTHHIYRALPWRQERPHIPALPLATGQKAYTEMSLTPSRRRAAAHDYLDPGSQHLEAIEANAPPSILIDDKYAILHISETAGRYLLQPKGPVIADLVKLVRPELRMELRTALFRVFDKNQAVITQPVAVQFNGHARRVLMSLHPRVRRGSLGEREIKQALVIFLEDEEDVQPSETSHQSETLRRDALVTQMESEVSRLREQLQVTIESSESYDEEMKASNEELQSLNEEYRSAAEELETSREELQSVNEELQTVNHELKLNLDEVSRSHSALENLMSATEIATLFLDRELRIRHYTPGMQALFNIMPTDRGRPIRHLTHTLHYDRLIEDAEDVLRTLHPVEQEVRGGKGEWLLLRLRPYRTTDDRVDGVIFTFVDITRLKQAEAELVELNFTLEQRVDERTRDLDEANQKIAQARDLFHTLFHANPIPTALTRADDDAFLDVNEEFLGYFKFQRDKIIGRSAREFGLGQELDTPARSEFVAHVRDKGKVGTYETQILLPSGETRNILASVQYLYLDNTDALITAFVDITGRVSAERQIRELAAELTASEQAQRHRLAQILHDDLQQRIFAVQMQLSFLREAYEQNDLRAFEMNFPQLDEWLGEALKITRRLSVDLSPPILQGEGLVEAIVWLASQMDEQYGLKVRIESEGDPGLLDEKLRVLVFYAIRELLFSAVKQAGTLQAAVRFEHGSTALRVIVRGHGGGFEGAAVMRNPSIAHDLQSLRHRLHLLGCSMEIDAEPGRGAEVTLKVPVSRKET